MKHPVILIALVLSLAAGTALVFAQDSGPADETAQKALKAKVLVDRLGSDDFGARSAAAKELIALGETALPALRNAAKSHPDTHVRYEAERLISRISKQESPLKEKPAGQAGGGAGGLIVPGVPEDFAKKLEEMMKRLQEQGLGANPEELFGPDFAKRMQEMQKELMKGLQGLQGLQEPLRGAFSGSVKGSTMVDGEKIEYERKGDGAIKVSITKDGETETFEAKDEEALKKDAPEVYKKVKPMLDNIVILHSPLDRAFRFGLRSRSDPLQPFTPGRRLTPTPAPGGFKLGVWTAPVSDLLRAHLKLRKGEGIVVEEVVPGSLADRMGMKKMDIIRSVNSLRISTTEDIRRSLSEVEPGGKVAVEVIRKGDPLKLIGNR